MEVRVLEDIESASLEVRPNSTLSKLVTSFKKVPMSEGSISLMIVQDELDSTPLGRWSRTLFLAVSPREFYHGSVPFE